MWGRHPDGAGRSHAVSAASARSHRQHEIVTNQKRERLLRRRREDDIHKHHLQRYVQDVKSVDSAIALQQRYGRGFVEHLESDFDRQEQEHLRSLELKSRIQERAARNSQQVQYAESLEAEETAAMSKKKMLQRLIEQDPELRRLRQHLDRAYQRRDNDASAAVKAQQLALAEQEEKQRIEARNAMLRYHAEEEKRARQLEEDRIAFNRQDNWALHENRHINAQEEYRKKLHRERLVNQFVEDQLQEEDIAKQRFEEENRQQIVSELQAQERHHREQKAMMEEQERLAREQDEWYQRVVERRRRSAIEKLKHKDEAHDRFIELFAQEVRRRQARDKELEWAQDVLNQDALEKQWAAQDAQKRALAQLIHDEMHAGNEALKQYRAAVIRDLKHREQLMVKEMMERARRAELAEVEEKENRLEARRRFIRNIEEQRQFKLEQNRLQLEREVAEQRAQHAAEQAYRDSVAAARKYLIEEHAPVLREYFPKVGLLILHQFRSLLVFSFFFLFFILLCHALQYQFL